MSSLKVKKSSVKKNIFVISASENFRGRKLLKKTPAKAAPNVSKIIPTLSRMQILQERLYFCEKIKTLSNNISLSFCY